MKIFQFKLLKVILICLTFTFITYAQNLNKTTVQLHIFDNSFNVNTYEKVVGNNKNNLLFLSLHHNEQIGIKAVKDTIERKGGKFIELESKLHDKPIRDLYFKYEDRQYKVDPNRMYNLQGIQEALKLYKPERERCTQPERRCWDKLEYSNESSLTIRDEVKKFGDKLLKLFIPTEDRNNILVSVHNNVRSSSICSGYSFLDYLTIVPLENYKKDCNGRASEVKWIEYGVFNKDQDVNYFFLVSNKKLFDELLDSTKVTWQHNIVLQKDSKGLVKVRRRTNSEVGYDDGSLSVYYGKKDWNYILVETEHKRGKLKPSKSIKRQKKMIRVLMKVFSDK